MRGTWFLIAGGSPFSNGGRLAMGTTYHHFTKENADGYTTDCGLHSRGKFVDLRDSANERRKKRCSNCVTALAWKRHGSKR